MQTESLTSMLSPKVKEMFEILMVMKKTRLEIDEVFENAIKEIELTWRMKKQGMNK